MAMASEMDEGKVYYDTLAPEYNSLSNKWANYLNGIDSYIINSFKDKKIINYMDIACGTGRRSKIIIDALKPVSSVLVDESENMIKIARKQFKDYKNVEIHQQNFLEYNTNRKFDFITCLWNVFGHLETEKLRTDFLKKISELLDDDGICIIDINNRLNINHYGLYDVLKTTINTLFRKRKAVFNIKHKDVTTHVYIHHAFELDRLIRRNNLKISAKNYIDYTTGKVKPFFFQGQIVYVIKKDSHDNRATS
jgi:SAM-dependent methyltransferase